MMRFGRCFICLLLLVGCLVVRSQNFIHVNQLGYLTNSPKIALVTEMDADAFTLRVASTNQVVYSKSFKEEQLLWTKSGEYIQMADFSDYKEPGRYYLQIGSERSFPFLIAESAVYDTLSLWSMKAFYLWRSSCEIKSDFATYKGESYARGMGHADTVVYIHTSVANEKRHAESEVSAPKGWYDSGDYSMYTVNAAYAVKFLAMAYELYPEYFKAHNLNIPESGNGVPDVLNELKWELDWLMAMFDESDGGVYFKLSSLKFSKMTMPEHDLQDRYMIGKSTSSALSFAASMAIAARLYAPYEDKFPGFSVKALSMAEKAYQWAERNPKVFFDNPEGVFTGTYSDMDVSDEFFNAAAELFVTTRKKFYYDRLNLVQQYDTPTWYRVNSLGLLTLALHEEALPEFVDRKKINVKSQGLFDNIYKLYYYSAGKLPLREFLWGSNGDVATNGAVMMVGYKMTGNPLYLDGAQASLDYLLGRNSLDYCFVTGFGSRSPKHIHDRRSENDGIKPPLPGYLVGGPNLEQASDCGQSSYPSSVYPARAYLDEFCSYSTNEIAINWNAPLVLLVAGLINSQKH